MIFGLDHRARLAAVTQDTGRIKVLYIVKLDSVCFVVVLCESYVLEHKTVDPKF